MGIFPTYMDGWIFVWQLNVGYQKNLPKPHGDPIRAAHNLSYLAITIPKRWAQQNHERKACMYVCSQFFQFLPLPGCVLWKTNNQSCKKKWYVFFPYYPTFFLGCYIVTSFNVLALWPKGPNVRQLYEKLKSIQRLTVRALRLTNQRFV